MKNKITPSIFCILIFILSFNFSFAQSSSSTTSGIDTLIAPQGVSSITTCNAKIFDIGGPTAGYPYATNSIITIYPTDTCLLSQITGSSSLSYMDKIIFYDGVGIDGTVLGTFIGWNSNLPPIKSISGPITIRHFGNYGGSNGFNLTAVCVSGCKAPKIVSFLAEEDSLQLNWSNCFSGLYDLEYRAISDSTWNSISNISGTNYTLNNLLYQTKYEIKIRTHCDTTHSGWNRFYIYSSCPYEYTLPFYDDFLDTITCFTFSEQNKLNFAVNNYNFESPYIANPTQNYVLQYKGANYGSNSSGYVITPRISDLETGDEIRYWYFRSNQTSQPGSIQIYVNSYPSLTGALMIQEIPRVYNVAPSVPTQGFYEYRAIIPAETFNYVIFKTVSVDTATHILDKISIVKGSISCPSPTTLTISNVNSNSLTLNWLETGTATNWQIEYGPFGSLAGTGTILSNISSNPYQINGLPFGQVLGFRVRSIQQGDTSAWSSQKICIPGWIFVKPGTLYLTSCQLRYFDNGGPYNNYSSNNSGNLVIYPTTPNSKITFTGSANLSSSGSLGIYSGTSATGTNLIGSLNPSTPVRSHLGPLTINFTGGYFVDQGFDISISCVDSSCWAPLSQNAQNITHDEVTISWIHFINNKPVQIAYKPISSSTWSYVNQDTSLSLVITGLLPNTIYQYKIRSICAAGDTSNFTGTQSFKTECVPITSFYEDFENVPIDSIPLCWSKFPAVSSSKVVDTNSFTTSRTLNFKNIGSHMIVFPNISNLGLGSHQFRMKIRTNSNLTFNQLIHFGYLTNPYDNNSFVCFDTLQLATPFFFEYIITPPLGITSFYPAIRGTSVLSNDLYIDDIYWEPIPICTTPINFVSALVTDHSCDLKWDSYNNSNPISWEIQYGPSGFVPGTGTTQFVQADSVTVTGLSPFSNYDFYVRAICSVTDTSSWSNKLSIKTYCSNSELPIEENFESDFENSSCWTKTHNNFYGNTGFAVVSSGTNPTCSPQSGLKMLYFNSFYFSSGAYALLFSPRIECNGSQILLSFYQYRDNGYSSSQYNGEGIAIYSNSIPSLEGADSIGFVARQYSINNWYLIEFLLPEGIIGSKYFIFKAISKFGNNIFVDNFKIKYLCPSPFNITVSNILYNEADLEWQSDTMNNSFILDYKKTTENTWTSILNIVGNNYHLTNLEQNETYQVRVRALCDTSGMSGNTSITFTTLQDCSPPTNINLIDSLFMDTSVTLTWTHSFNYNYYEIRYKSVNDPDWITDTTDQNYYVINNLIPNHNYQIRLKSICSIETSVLTSNIYFTTKCKTPLNLSIVDNSITAYSAQVFWSPQENENQWNLYYKKINDNEWIQIIVTDTFYTFNNLVPNSTYLVKLKSQCDDNESAFTEPIQFSTLVSDISQNQINNYFTIVPIPSSDYIEVILINDQCKVETIEIINTIGATMFKKDNPEFNLKVDISKLSSGIYFVKLRTNLGVFNKKILKL